MAGLGALLSGFVDALFERLASEVVNSLFQGKTSIPELLKELEIKLRSANKLLNDADEKQLTDKDVREWLDDVREVHYEADHVIDKINYEALRCNAEEGEQSGSKKRKLSDVIKFCSPFDNTIKSEIKEILAKLDPLLKRKDELGLIEGVHQNRPQRLPTPLVDACDVYGRDAEKEAIVELLLSDHNGGRKLSVIPIVGMGGIGKTTLAQFVYNDSTVQDHFSLKVWVTVSEEFDVFKLKKKIFEAITSSKCDIQDLFHLQTALKKEVMGKRFLFVLDDVWNENYDLWDALRGSFDSGADGSKILVTTRSEIVASRMGTVQAHTLQMIPDDDCWKLFARHAFDNRGSGVHLDLQEMGKEIVKKCKGLPLAIKSIAGVLRSLSSSEEWRGILQSDVWDLQFQENQKNKILPALWLSYQFLPPNLKRCFAYCSIFPKDYEFREDDKETIVLLWMAEGLLQPEKGKRMEDVGKSYLDALISRSFFQRSIQDGDPILLMHDLVHDLAMRISGEYCFTLDGCDHLNGFTSKTRHLSYRKGEEEDITKLQGLSKTKFLRTLLALPLSLEHYKSKVNIPCELFQGVGGCLKVLSLSQSSFIELPNSIGDLKHLRYLDLSYTNVEEIPSSVCTLYNLQTLLLLWCEKLTQLPTNTCSLINLRHLVIRNIPLKEMPPQMCKLKNLQTLSDFVLGENGGSRIKELGQLKSLQGSLHISGLENVVDVGDVLQADLKNKECLTELCLIWKQDSISNDSTKEKEVLTALKPHKMLKILRIKDYRGTMFPDWVACKSFSDMVEVTLDNCKNCCRLPPLGQLPSLRELKIWHMDGLESIGDEFCGTPSTTPFPSLEKLHIKYMGSLERWSFTGAVQAREIFPHLKTLRIESCAKLNVGLPAGCFPSLEELEIRDMGSLERWSFTGAEQAREIFPHLKTLRIVSCAKLNVELSAGCFPSLEELVILDMASQERWSFTGAEQAREIFPHLKTLCIESCAKLNVELSAGCFPSLEELVIQDMGSLERWSFTGAEQAREIFRHLKTLFIAYCDKLNAGLPAGCFPSLETIEIFNCKEMVSAIPTSQAEIDSAYPSLQSIRLWFCPRLESFSGMGFPSNLKKLEIWGCEMLIANRMKWDLQRLSSLQSLFLREFEIEGGVDSFPEEGLLPSTLTSLSIIEFKNLETLNGKSFHSLTSLQELTISSCEELQCLPEEGLPLSLARLEIYDSPLLNERCQRGTGEDWPKIQHIPNITIDSEEI